ncbi:SubName: Full=Uncharacterized protein {ECO:0000313/EMBL:CCA71765.1} [Serendipita indica DSM 11827]|nr:SubName: Full=Uncharacterized protein {ECO:0000313/EMBL:CCA71765.1} [Serendipita indica DSM 11827]
MNRQESLLNDIIKALSKLPGRRRFAASVVVSQTRKSPASLFPYAPGIHDQEVYLQDVAVLVAEDVNKASKEDKSPSATPTDQPNGEKEDTSESYTYVSALEAILYIFPATHSVIIYVSKVDSTGQGRKPSPTRTLVVAFLEYVTRKWFGTYTTSAQDGRPHLSAWSTWVHLFARSQNQYLFPASIEYPGKRLLPDIALVKWWKGVVDDFAVAITSPHPSTRRKEVSKYVIVPGLTPLEISHALKIPLSNLTPSDWSIGHPYSKQDIRFPLGVRPPCSISQLIPYFPDDPKARLIDEIANSTSKASATVVSSPKRKRRKLNDGEQAIGENESEAQEGKEEDKVDMDFVRLVSAEEFWERMDGRQECRLGTVAFFTVHIKPELDETCLVDSATTHAPLRRAEITPGMILKITTALDSADFGSIEKSVRSTSALQGMIKALTGGLVNVTSKIPGISQHVEEAAAADEEEVDILSTYITREVEVDNPELAPKTEPPAAAPVTILTARKKKKPLVT